MQEVKSERPLQRGEWVIARWNNGLEIPGTLMDEKTGRVISRESAISLYPDTIKPFAAHEPRRVTREMVNQRLPGCTCDSAYKDRGLIDHECHHHAMWDYLPALLADLGLEVAADTPAQEK